MSQLQGLKKTGFSLAYRFYGETVPPPYHREYTIFTNSKGEGKIAFWPDYIGEGIPVWKYSFDVSQKQIDHLLSLFTESNCLRDVWEKDEMQPAGGDLESLTITVLDKAYKIPPAIKERNTVTKLYAFINSLVPKEVWEELEEKKKAYEEG